ncbi:MAG: AsmA family protein [Pseudomonadota bacterium]
MGIKLVKWVMYLLLLLLIVVMCAVALVGFAPHRAVDLLEQGTGYAVSADNLEINVSTPALYASDLLVLAPDGRELLRAEELRAGLNALGAWRGTTPFWDIVIRNAHFYLAPTADEPKSSVEPAAALDFARILRARSADIDSLTVHAGETETRYSLFLNRVEDNAFNLQIGTNDVLTVEGTLNYQLGSRTKIELALPDLNLKRTLDSGTKEANVDQNMQSAGIEAAMDWSWLGMLRNADLSLQIGKLQLPEQTIKGVHANLEFAQDGLDLSLQLVSLMFDADEDKILENMTLRANVSALALTTQGQDLIGNIALESEGLMLGADGKFNINGSNGNELALFVELESSSGISPVLPVAVAPYLPMQLKTDLLIDSSKYQLDALQASFGESDIAGMLSLAFNDGAAIVRANLHSKALVLAKAEKATQAEAEMSEPQARPADKSDKLFSQEPLAWEWLEQGDIDVKLTAEILQLYDARFNDFALLAKGEQGSLTIDPLEAKFGGGGFSGMGSVAKVESGATAKLTFEMSGVDLEAFGLVSQEQLTGGKTELELALNTSGNSSADLAGALQGTVHILVHDAVVQNDSFELIGSDILLETLNKLNPFAKADPTTKLHCALVHFDIDDGQMVTDKALVVETEKMEIIGDGSINLDDETLDILITPNAKQTVGLNVGSVVKFMKLGGTLANPSPAVDAGGLLKSGASIGAAVSTGGVSLLAENLVKKVAEQNACKAALATN